MTLAAWPAVVDLSALDGTNGFAFFGAVAGNQAGYAVSSAGDINADGVDDILVVASTAGLQPGAYVIFGGASVGATGSMLAGSLDGTNGFIITGTHTSQRFDSASSAGDVNGDGIDDIIIGSIPAIVPGNANDGRCFVIFGGPNIGASGTITTSSLTGATGFVINSHLDNVSFGGVVAGARDINDDGVGDIVIGAYRSSGGAVTAGQSFVLFGAPGLGAGGSIELSSLNGADGFVINGASVADFSGKDVASAGDVNGDGIDDLLIAAYWGDPLGRTNAGECFVIFGDQAVGSTGTFDLASVDGSNGFVIGGEAASDYCGVSVSGAGDVNGDGFDDVILGAVRAGVGSTEAGKAYVVFGGAQVGQSGLVDLALLDGSSGFELNGITDGEYAGYAVSEARDLNADGYGDIVIGAHRALQNFGRSYVVYGHPTVGAGGIINLASLDGSSGTTFNGFEPGHWSGFSVSFAGDVNNDQIQDIILGGFRTDAPGLSDAGAAFILFGAPTTPPTCAGDVNGDGDTNISDFNILAGNFGAAVTPNTSGDLTGDGLVNISDFNILAGDFGCGTP